MSSLFIERVQANEAQEMLNTKKALLRDDITKEARAWLEGELAGKQFMLNELAQIDPDTYEGIWLEHGTIAFKASLRQVGLDWEQIKRGYNETPRDTAT